MVGHGYGANSAPTRHTHPVPPHALQSPVPRQLGHQRLPSHTGHSWNNRTLPVPLQRGQRQVPSQMGHRPFCFSQALQGFFSGEMIIDSSMSILPLIRRSARPHLACLQMAARGCRMPSDRHHACDRHAEWSRFADRRQSRRSHDGRPPECASHHARPV